MHKHAKEDLRKMVDPARMARFFCDQQFLVSDRTTRHERQMRSKNATEKKAKSSLNQIEQITALEEHVLANLLRNTVTYATHGSVEWLQYLEDVFTATSRR